jgi:hypothetical protein
MGREETVPLIPQNTVHLVTFLQGLDRGQATVLAPGMTELEMALGTTTNQLRPLTVQENNAMTSSGDCIED